MRSVVGTVVDGCDTNTRETKHGGSIGFGKNANLTVAPLSVRREWDGGKPDYHVCNGVDNKHYVTQSTLAANIKDYCSAFAGNKIVDAEVSFQQDYNGSTPDYVTLTTVWPKGAHNYQIFEEECDYYMNAIMNGCDVPSGSSNPMNWKHGGSMESPNGIKYTIQPNAERAQAPNAPLGECNSWYNVIWASFKVWGGGFADSDFGTTPEGLKDQIHGCGVITKWKVEYYDSSKSDGTEWYATGRLPIGTRRCVSRAIATAGGFSKGCGGNG